jgi:hypothetical protein
MKMHGLTNPKSTPDSHFILSPPTSKYKDIHEISISKSVLKFLDIVHFCLDPDNGKRI